MSIFFTADLHLCHKNILKYVPIRGERWNDQFEMNAGIRELWNKTIQPKDEVYILGDVVLTRNVEYVIEYFASLNGAKYLILGNHDKLIQKNPKDFLGAFRSIDLYKEIYVNNQKFCLFHYAMRVWNQKHFGSIHLHGHSHGTLAPHGKSVDVGIDSSYVTGRTEHRPFSFDEVMLFMEKQETIKDFEGGIHGEAIEKTF